MRSEKDDFAKFLANNRTSCHPFQMSRKVEMQSCQWYGVKRLNLFSKIKEIAGQGLEHLCITSSRFHLFNKTDLEQYLSKARSTLVVKS